MHTKKEGGGLRQKQTAATAKAERDQTLDLLSAG
jgi:hypothetical protein